MGLLRRLLGSKREPSNAEVIREVEERTKRHVPGDADAVTDTEGTTRVQGLQGKQPAAREEKRCPDCGFLVPLDDAGPPGAEPPDRHEVCPPKFYDWPEGQPSPTRDELEALPYRERHTMELMLPIGDQPKASYRRVGEVFQITPERVRLIVNQTERKLLELRDQKRFAAKGPTSRIESADPEEPDPEPMGNSQRASQDNGRVATAAKAGAPRISGVENPLGFDLSDPAAVAARLTEEASAAHVKGPGGKWISVYVGDVWEPIDPRRKGRAKVLRIIFGKGEYTDFDPLYAEVEIKSPFRAVDGRKVQVRLQSFRPEISRGYKLVLPSEQRDK